MAQVALTAEASCREYEEPRTVVDVHAVTLDVKDHPFSIAAVSCRIRLLDCQAFVLDGALRVLEFADFPVVPYAAVSYTWRGVSAGPTLSRGGFAVEGAEEADPVGTDVLRHACTAALLRGCSYLWMDRLCIIQTSRKDKNWHIMRMHRIYSSCKVCIVSPGGMHRLVRLDEETSWIHRSWTLLEALAPPEVVVLFRWELHTDPNDVPPLQEVVAGQSAMLPLDHLRDASAGCCAFAPSSAFSSETAAVDLVVFGARLSGYTLGDVPFWRRQHRLHNIIALRIAMLDAEADERAYAIWQSAMMRTSARPTDMVFSIMGLFGVTLDPSPFDPDDLRSATLALARAILDAKGCVAWLGAMLHLHREEHISPLPMFPLPSVSGPAFVRTNGELRETSEGITHLVHHETFQYIEIPKGRMDQLGCLTFIAPAVRLRRMKKDDVAAYLTWDALDGSCWMEDTQLDAGPQYSMDSSPVVYGAVFGWLRDYNPSKRPSYVVEEILVMVLEERRTGDFRLRSFFTLRTTGDDFLACQGWPKREFFLECPDSGLTRSTELTCTGNAADHQAIVELSAQTLATRGRSFRISTSATTGRIRLVDCEALADRDVVRVVEFGDFPRFPYSAVSYPWRGVHSDSATGPTFSVEGAEQADPIAVDVLKQACITSLIKGCRYLWLDRLCIIQTDRADKDWHIRYMCRIFKSCALCLVLPGGMGRLVRLDEETPWIHRSWTLLEAVAPHTVFLLFTWELGWGKAETRHTIEYIREVIPGRSALAMLYFVLERCVVGYLSFTPFSPRAAARQTLHKVSIFGAWPDNDDVPFWRLQYKLFSPQATALITAISAPRGSREAHTNALWQSVFMRTSSRPVDMVLSIMGLFGVTLDPAAFHEDDRHGATLALARKILEAGGRPNWLGAAFHLEFNDSIPTFPVFPIASPAGPAYVRVKDKEVEVSQCFGRPLRLSGNTLPFPTCTIDDAGRLVLTAGATRIQTLADVSATTRFIKAMDGSRWSMMSSDTDPQAGSRCAAYVARIGLFGHQYEETNISTDLYTIRLMVLEEHHPALFHLRSYAYLHGIDEEIVRTWPECTLRIGTCKKVANPSETGERTICDVSASSLGGGGPLKIFDGASTCRFRLIDCEALVERDRLRIIQFPDIPTLSYTTISYPWRGVTVDSTFTCHRFRVDGAPDADPISVHILKQACTASLIRGSPYLWVDTLFIIQTSDEDKIWQIKLMYRVYKSCALCIVVPGGLQRLVPLDEETPWIHRSWTLQEAIAPSEVVVLFAWKLGWAAGGNMAATGIGNIHEVVPGECAIAPLTLILNASAEGFLAVQPASREYTSNSLLACCIFGAEPFANPSGAASSPGSSNRKLLAPVVVALAMAMDTSLGDPEIRAHAVWQSALMRTSFRPVDMILSIMGVFGVSLDPAAFQMDDRRGAAIALAQEILKRGGRASWLGAACGVPPEKTLSTFPSFPRNTTNGAASIHVNGTAYKVPDLVGAAIYPLDHAGLGSIPKGSMDDAGYLTFSARAIPLRYLASEPEDVGVVSERTIEALDGSRWALGTTMGTDSLKPARRAVFGALLGWTSEYYPGLAPFAIDNIRVMVLEEHRAKQFHVRTFFYLSRCEVRNILTWPERTFSVGGPHTPADICKSQAGEASPQDDTSWSPRHHPSDTLVQLEETASQYACRALPQLVLERFRQDALREHSGEFYVWTGTNVPPEHCYDKLRLAM